MVGAYFGLTIRDSSDELGRTEFNIGDITAVSLPGALTQMGAFRDALDAITLGTMAGTRFGDADLLSNAVPASKLAQRGIKWNLSLEDTVTLQKFTNKVPTADLSLLPAPVSGITPEDLDLTAGVGLTLKTAADALLRSAAGNPVRLLRCYYSD